MSAVTKTFVVLLVILSLLLTASVVVFVNKVDDYKQKAESAENQAKLQEEQRMVAVTELSAAKWQRDQDLKSFQDEMSKAKQQMATQENQATQLRGDKANLDKQLSVANANITQLGESLKLAQASLGDAGKEIASLRDLNTDLTKKYGDLNILGTQKTKENESLKQQLRIAQEQVAELQSQNTRLAAGGGAAAAEAPVAPLPINGVIRDVRSMNNMLFATVSVGRADHVEKGMKFQVISGDQYMGTLTVDQVDANEAFGRLDGPKAAEIRPQMQVRTQL